MGLLDFQDRVAYRRPACRDTVAVVYHRRHSHLPLTYQHAFGKHSRLEE